ncbi:LytTR family DNA-binding domain-containing protein [Caulobacter sp. KR2-114]|uniref:LytTR family DNA-binding domain-containing protein n=1 Tax=Caulobacter sp. KR2-114 TaxID=3400912 RepID=UPI003C055078
MAEDGAGQGAETAGRRPARPTRADLAAWALLVALMLLVTAVISFTRVSDLAGTSKAVPLRVSLAWDFTSTAVWIAFLPVIGWAAARFPLPQARPWRPVLFHLLASAPLSMAHVVLMGLVRWGLSPVLGGRYDPFWPLRNGLYEYRKDVLTYGALLGFFWTWRAWRAARETRAAPPTAGGLPGEAPPLEVRDGARRHFVRPADILWAEAAGNYVALRLQDRELLMRTPLSALASRLEAAGFARIHRSRLVNRACIATVASTPAGDFTVTLRDGRTLAGSRRYRQSLSGDTPA